VVDKEIAICIKTRSVLIQNARRFHTKRIPFWAKTEMTLSYHHLPALAIGGLHDVQTLPGLSDNNFKP